MKKIEFTSAFVFFIIMNVPAQNQVLILSNQLNNSNQNIIPQQIVSRNFNWNSPQNKPAPSFTQNKKVVVNTNKPSTKKSSVTIKPKKIVNRPAIQNVRQEITSNKINNLPEVNQQAQSQIANGNQSLIQQVILFDNVNLDNQQKAVETSNRGNEQKEVNTNGISNEFNKALGEIKIFQIPQRNKSVSFKVSKNKRKNHDIKHSFFRVSRKLDSAFGRHVNTKPAYTCFVW